MTFILSQSAKEKIHARYLERNTKDSIIEKIVKDDLKKNKFKINPSNDFGYYSSYIWKLKSHDELLEIVNEMLDKELYDKIL